MSKFFASNNQVKNHAVAAEGSKAKQAESENHGKIKLFESDAEVENNQKVADSMNSNQPMGPTTQSFASSQNPF